MIPRPQSLLSPTVLCGLAYLSLASLLVWSISPLARRAPLPEAATTQAVVVQPELVDALLDHNTPLPHYFDTTIYAGHQTFETTPAAQR